MKKTKLLLISLLLTDFVMLLQPENAWAGDVQIMCDLRVLELTSQQRNQIRLRRQQYKTRQRQMNENLMNQNVTDRQLSLRHFFSKSAFDNQQADEIAKQRYANDVRQTVAELNFYHDIFQLLDNRQREIWLQQCVQPAGRI